MELLVGSECKGGGLSFSNLSFALESWRGAQLIDVDLDGHLDLVAYDITHDGFNDGQRLVFSGNGQGNFALSPTKVPLGRVLPVGAADFNDDGLLDMAVFANPYTTAPPYEFNIYLNSMNSGFGEATKVSPNAYFDGPTAYGDFNHDGRTDIAAGPLLFLQASDFSFPLAYTVPAGHIQPATAVAADLDGDGLTDLVLPQGREFGAWPTLQTYLQRKGVLVASPEGPLLGSNFPYSAEPLAAGDLNGDGCTDIAVASASDGLLVYRGMNCLHLPATVNDFDGDRKSDILWRNRVTGRNMIWKSASFATRQFIATVSDTSWAIAGTGDFDGNGKADILWRNTKTGKNAIWKNGYHGTQQPIGSVTNTSWVVAGVGDFDGDGRSDILWRNSGAGSNVLWLEGNSSRSKVLTVANRSSTVAAIGDFDADNRDDILWRSTSTGKCAIWLGGNSAAQQAVSAMSDPAWNVSGVGDFNRDGKGDILWRNAVTGANLIWRSANAATPLTVTSIKDPHWKVGNLGDYNADGATDIFWRNDATGADSVWLSASRGRPFVMAAVPDLSWAGH